MFNCESFSKSDFNASRNYKNSYFFCKTYNCSKKQKTPTRSKNCEIDDLWFDIGVLWIVQNNFGIFFIYVCKEFPSGCIFKNLKN